MKRIVTLLVLLLAATAAFADQSLSPEGALRRFAMFIGSNDGGPDRVTLRYAERDALSMAAVMQELGGVVGVDSLVLLAPTAFDVETGFQMMSGRIRQAREESRRVEFLLYYSGHSDEQGLLLGGERLAYPDLRLSIQGIQADVNIAVLDSCFSGAFTRLKGGTRKPPFVMDESVEMKGHAFLTSSSADEAAQESDGIQSSFFTHYLISGLRGAADSTRDGQVSLNEAYHYAFSETLSRTEKTQAGAQHASYNIQLTGTGDLTLTDLRVAASAILLREELEGRLFIRDGAGNLVVEMRKSRDVAVLLALPAGPYSLNLDREGRSFQAKLSLRPGARQEVAASNFSAAPREPTARRGPGGPIESWETWQDWGDVGYSVGRFVERKLEEVLNRAPSAGPVPRPTPRPAPLPGEPSPQAAEPAVPSEAPAEAPAAALPAPTATVPLNLGVVPFVSTSGVHPGGAGVHPGGAAVPPAFNLSLNLLVGYSYEIRGAELGGVLNITERNVAGAQAAGVGNIVGGDLRGLGWAGVFNVAGGDSRALQQAGVFNIVEGTAGIAQTAGVFNIAGGSLAGLQSAGVFNISKGRAMGAQAAGVFNIAEEDLLGVQLAGVFNAATRVKGAQLGVVNVSTDVDGTQIGLVNVAGGRVRGAQVGLVNISKDLDGIPIGLINIVEQGSFHAAGWYSELGIGYVGLEMGSRYVYTLVFGGMELVQDPGLFTVGLGLGLHIPMGPIFVNADLSVKEVYDRDDPLTWPGSFQDEVPIFPSARLAIGLNVFKFFSIFGGVIFDTRVPGTTLLTGLHRGSPFGLDIWGSTTEVYPKLFAGIRF